jgi:hypothetical protein
VFIVTSCVLNKQTLQVITGQPDRPGPARLRSPPAGCVRTAAK